MVYVEQRKDNSKKAHEQLSSLYFALARAYTIDEFNELMSKVDEIDPRVKSYLYQIGYEKWSCVYATVNRTWTMTLNIAELVNAANKDARELLVIALLEFMRALIERWNSTNMENATGSLTFLGKKYHKMLEDNKVLS
uniref:Uncharacterized protein n=2 Tax=Nicotiana TaxID=4085 RepID=A0A1S3YRI1_TOBAC|nr:PREDICTED: uncharacterized protein LOC104249710 [Nicotiana sylvestris]XP_016454672.1 PREDICTED: uncharacterized protein LOC107778859 [Nicotiana tabacum]